MIWNAIHNYYECPILLYSFPIPLVFTYYYETDHLHCDIQLAVSTKLSLKLVAKKQERPNIGNWLCPLWEVISNNSILLCLPVFSSPSHKIPSKGTNTLILNLKTRSNLGKVMDFISPSQKGRERMTTFDRFW